MKFDGAKVVAVCLSPTHSFSKRNQPSITLIQEVGVEGDAHSGTTVKHRSRVAADPTQPNLRQIHLIHSELFDELRTKGFHISPGQMGENITTRGIPLLQLPRGARLHIGENAIVEVTGLRNPCKQLDDFQAGLMPAVLDKDEQGNLIRKAGIMGIVLCGGVVRPNDSIQAFLPEPPYYSLERV
jgi:MOSC domain-containing protein YiiM